MKYWPMCPGSPKEIGYGCSFGPFLNLYGCTIGDDCTIGAYVEIQTGAVVGNHVKIGSHSFICSGVTIEDDVFIGHGVMTTNDKHPVAVRDGKRSVQAESEILSTIIERGASIGSGSVLLPVRIGAGAVIGAGSVVTRDVPAGQTWIGNPARCDWSAWKKLLSDTTSLKRCESELEDERKCAREFFTLKTKEAPVEPDAIKCPKCGSDKVYLKYVKPEPSVVIGGTIKHHEQPERMKRECGRCGYYWHAECEDWNRTTRGAYHMSTEPRAQHLKDAIRKEMTETEEGLKRSALKATVFIDGKAVDFYADPLTGRWVSEQTIDELRKINIKPLFGTGTTGSLLAYVGAHPLEDMERRRKEMTE